MKLPPAWLDGCAEAERRLWRSADESFAAAETLAPDDPRPPLARASCLLARGAVREALVLLETHPALAEPPPEYRANVAWMRALARLAADDPLGAEQAAAPLPDRARRRLAAMVLLRRGQYAAGVTALLGATPRSAPDAPRRDHS